MTKYALPSAPDLLGVDGITVGRAVGLLVVLAGTVLAQTALKVLGDQYNAIGVSAYFFSWIVGRREARYILSGL